MTEREKIEQERNQKWAERGRKFWSAFLFTKDGKPKSGFLTYTFCLSIAEIFLYVGLFWAVTTVFTPLMAGWAPWLNNLVQSLLVAVCGLGLNIILHRLFKDKKLIFGTYVWLILYTILTVISQLIMLKGTGAYPEFFTFMLWFVFLPLLVAVPVMWYLWKRDDHPEKGPEEEPAWKKYINT